MRLLLVEDHAELAIWVGKTLRQSGFTVDVIDRGDHAATALLKMIFFIVFTFLIAVFNLCDHCIVNQKDE